MNKLQDTTMWHAQSIDKEEYALLSALLRWPPHLRFPVIDMASFLILHPTAAAHYARIYFASLYDETAGRDGWRWRRGRGRRWRRMKRGRFASGFDTSVQDQFGSDRFGLDWIGSDRIGSL
jgi:hypothetical protein